MNVTSALGWWISGGSSPMSGAIDVVAVRQSDETFSCSPWHVKLPVRAKTKGHKTVSLFVNGQSVKVSMRLGSAGEAFFIVKNQLNTSPPPPPLPSSSKIYNDNDDVVGKVGTDIVSDANLSIKSSQFTLRKSLSSSQLYVHGEKSRKDFMQGDLLNISPSRINSPAADITADNYHLSMKTSNLSTSLTLETPKSSQENLDPIEGCRRRFHSYAEGSAVDVSNKSLEACIHDMHTLNSASNVNDKEFPPLTKNNLAQAQVQHDGGKKSTAPDMPPARVTTTWKWTWGDLPIKFSDPSIADLHSVTTNMALLEKKRGNHGADTAGNNSTDSSDLPHLQLAGKASLGTDSTPTSPSPSEHVREDISKSENCSKINFSQQAQTFLNENMCIEKGTTRKECNIINNTGTCKLEDDNSEDIVSLIEPEKNDSFPLLHRNTSTVTAVEVAAALTAEDRSTRILSLCGHVLSGAADSPEQAPATVEALREILSKYAVSEDQFARTPIEIVTNPNLVVVVNDLLIPWCLVHNALLANMIISEGDEDKSESSKGIENISNVINNDNAVLWAGMNVNSWNNKEICFETGKIKDDDDYGQMESISDRSSTIDNRTSISKECELFYADESVELLNGAYGGYFKSTTCEGDSVNVNMWSKESVDWNSSTDLTKMQFHMFRSFTLGNDEFVPDLLRPYVDASKEKDSSLRSNASEIQEVGSEDSKNSRRGQLELREDTHNIVGVRETLGSNKLLVGAGSRGDVPSPMPSLQASRSHDSALDSLIIPVTSQSPHLHDLTRLPTDFSVTRIVEEQETFHGSSFVVHTDDLTISNTATNTTTATLGGSGADRSGGHFDAPRSRHELDLEEEQDLSIPSFSPVVSREEGDFLSPDNISPDDIRPGPARGDITNNDESDTESFYSLSFDDVESCTSNSPPDTDMSEGKQQDGHRRTRKYLYRKSLVPSQEQMQAMNLVNGQNEIIFQVEGEDPVQAHMYVWPPDAKVIVADIEGALFVTKGGKSLGKLAMSLWGGGGLLTLGSRSGAQKETHEGLAQLFNNIADNGYHFLYITTSPNASSKDDLLKSQQMGGPSGLPLGPVFLPPDALIQTFGRDRTDLYKAAALRGVRTLFAAGQHNPYHAAFGALEKDVRAFDRCGLPRGRTFLVNEQGEITTVTSATVKRTFQDMNAMLHEVFPTISDAFCCEKATSAKSSSAAEDAYGDFNFWRVPPTLLRL